MENPTGQNVNFLDIKLPMTGKFYEQIAQELIRTSKKNFIKKITEKAIEIKKAEILATVYTPQEIAKNTKLSTQTIHKHIEKGYLKAFGPGRQKRITAEAYQEYINNRF